MHIVPMNIQRMDKTFVAFSYNGLIFTNLKNKMKYCYKVWDNLTALVNGKKLNTLTKYVSYNFIGRHFMKIKS